MPKLSHNRPICSGDTGRKNIGSKHQSKAVISKRMSKWSDSFLRTIAAENKNPAWVSAALETLAYRAKHDRQKTVT